MNSVGEWGIRLSAIAFVITSSSYAGVATAKRVFSDDPSKNTSIDHASNTNNSRSTNFNNKNQTKSSTNQQRIFSDSKSFNSQSSSVDQSSSARVKKAVTKNLPVANAKNFSFEPFYFGYFGDGMKNVGTGNYLSETANRANVHFIKEEPEDYAAWKVKLEQVKKSNKQAILMVQHVVYPWQSVIPYEDADVRFKKFYKELEAYSGLIAGYYLYDEPYHNNTMKGAEAKPLQEVYDGLSYAASSIKAVDSIGKVIVTLAYPEIELNPQIPESIDWFGVNCYYVFGDPCSEEKLAIQFAYVKKIKKSHQKLILTLDAYFNEVVSASKQKDMIKRIQFWFNLTKDADVIAYFPFLYQTSRVGEQLIGASDHPVLLNFLDRIFNKIKSSGGSVSHSGNAEYVINLSAEPVIDAPSPSPSPTPSSGEPTCQILEPKCEGKDYVRRDSCGKEVERWKNAPAPYCSQTNNPEPVVCTILEPKCENGEDYVRRDSCGKEIERWKNAPAPYCCKVLEPTCEGKDYVRRDSCGKEIERWKNAPAPYCK